MNDQRTSRMTASSWSTRLLLWCSCSLFFACSSPTDQSNNNNSNAIKEGVSPLSVAVVEIPLPDAFSKEKSFWLGSVKSLGTLIGGDSGLFHLGNNTLRDIDNDSVVGIAPWRGKFLVIAQKKQLLVWDSDLHESKLDSSFGEQNIVTLSAQFDDTLWIATKEALWRLKDKEMVAYESLNNVVELHTFLGSALVVARRGDGSFFVLGTDTEGELRVNELQTNAPSLQSLVPAPDGTLWGMSGGKLVRRKPSGDGFVWDDVSWGEWSPEPGKLQETVGAIQHMGLDVNSGRLWLVTEKAIVAILGKQLQWTPRPEALKEIKAISATLDTTFWISDGTKVHRFVRTESTEISYEGQIATFMKNNCLRCHADVGPGRPLNTYETVKTYTESIIKQLEQNLMPPDQKPLVGGDVLLFKRWMEKKMPK
ncbi:MAG: hypothetical protein EP343_34190 [Deltaproteobacteria bacterium]|nr:MAG: hypothetical protein EP343_34190 [Deltaproteobacteria bacterium]